MKNQLHLEINKPCTENFNHFTPTQKGGFCGSCEKEVIDFSKMNPDQVMLYFKKNKNQDTCGKFKSNQLKMHLENKPISKKYSFWSGIGLACLAFLSFNTGQAQTNINERNTITKKQEKKSIVKGNISDESEPLPGVNIILQGTEIGTSTDFDGNFEFPSKLKIGDVLICSYIGYDSKKVIITNDSMKTNIELKINMKSDSYMLMGKVATKKIYSSKHK